MSLFEKLMTVVGDTSPGSQGPMGASDVAREIDPLDEILGLSTAPKRGLESKTPLYENVENSVWLVYPAGAKEDEDLMNGMVYFLVNQWVRDGRNVVLFTNTTTTDYALALGCRHEPIGSLDISLGSIRSGTQLGTLFVVNGPQYARGGPKIRSLWLFLYGLPSACPTPLDFSVCTGILVSSMQTREMWLSLNPDWPTRRVHAVGNVSHINPFCTQAQKVKRSRTHIVVYPQSVFQFMTAMKAWGQVMSEYPSVLGESSTPPTLFVITNVVRDHMYSGQPLSVIFPQIESRQPSVRFMSFSAPSAYAEELMLANVFIALTDPAPILRSRQPLLDAINAGCLCFAPETPYYSEPLREAAVGLETADNDLRGLLYATPTLEQAPVWQGVGTPLPATAPAAAQSGRTEAEAAAEVKRVMLYSISQSASQHRALRKAAFSFAQQNNAPQAVAGNVYSIVDAPSQGLNGRTVVSTLSAMDYMEMAHRCLFSSEGHLRSRGIQYLKDAKKIAKQCLDQTPQDVESRDLLWVSRYYLAMTELGSSTSEADFLDQMMDLIISDPQRVEAYTQAIDFCVSRRRYRLGLVIAEKIPKAALELDSVDMAGIYHQKPFVDKDLYGFRPIFSIAVCAFETSRARPETADYLLQNAKELLATVLAHGAPVSAEQKQTAQSLFDAITNYENTLVQKTRGASASDMAPPVTNLWSDASQVHTALGAREAEAVSKVVDDLFG